MVRTITDDGSNEFTVESIAKNWGTKAETAIAEIDADLTILEGAPSNAEILAAIINCVQRQRKVINGVWQLAKFHDID